MVVADVPNLGPGEMLVRNLCSSLEAAIRGWLDGKAKFSWHRGECFTVSSPFDENFWDMHRLF